MPPTWAEAYLTTRISSSLTSSFCTHFLGMLFWEIRLEDRTVAYLAFTLPAVADVSSDFLKCELSTTEKVRWVLGMRGVRMNHVAYNSRAT